MAKIISTKDFLDLVRPEVKIVDQTIDVTALPALYEKHLPDGITMDTVKTVHTYDQRVFEAFSHATTDKLAELVKAEPELAALETSVEIEGHKMSVAFSRPVGEDINKAAWASSVGFGYGVPKPESLNKKLRGSFAEAMMATEDEEE